MTLILTHLSQYGIIHASDSNLTADNMNADIGDKTFAVPFLKAGLTVAGQFSVSGQRMDVWMRSFIQTQSREADLTLSGFAHNLADALRAQMSPKERTHGTLMHIAGYVQDGAAYHPEFWYVRNVELDPQTGGYCEIPDFRVSEDFWTRDCPDGNLMEEFQKDTKAYIIYINGFSAGRISYLFLQPVMRRFLESIWNNPAWKFRPPKSLEESKILVELYMQVITSLFLLSDYPAQYIGGGTQTCLIPQPENIVTSCRTP